jgi:hypothetical protein
MAAAPTVMAGQAPIALWRASPIRTVPDKSSAAGVREICRVPFKRRRARGADFAQAPNFAAECNLIILQRGSATETEKWAKVLKFAKVKAG